MRAFNFRGAPLVQLIAILLIGMMPVASIAGPLKTEGPMLYLEVSNGNPSDTIKIVDTSKIHKNATNSDVVVKSIKIPSAGPFAIGEDAHGHSQAYILYLDMIDNANLVTGNIKHFSAYTNKPQAWFLSLSPDSKKIYVSDDDEISTIDAETGSLLNRTNLGIRFSVDCIGFSPDSRYAYFGGLDSGVVRVMDTSTYEQVGEFNPYNIDTNTWLESAPSNQRISKDGRFLYSLTLRLASGNKLTVIDISSKKTVIDIPIIQPLPVISPPETVDLPLVDSYCKIIESLSGDAVFVSCENFYFDKTTKAVASNTLITKISVANGFKQKLYVFSGIKQYPVSLIAADDNYLYAYKKYDTKSNPVLAVFENTQAGATNPAAIVEFKNIGSKRAVLK